MNDTWCWQNFRGGIKLYKIENFQIPSPIFKKFAEIFNFSSFRGPILTFTQGNDIIVKIYGTKFKGEKKYSKHIFYLFYYLLFFILQVCNCMPPSNFVLNFRKTIYI